MLDLIHTVDVFVLVRQIKIFLLYRKLQKHNIKADEVSIECHS